MTSKGNTTRKRGIAILNVLYKFTDLEHGLTVDEIIENVKSEYGFSAGTYKTVSEYCSALEEMSNLDRKKMVGLDRKVKKIKGKGGRVYWAAEPVIDGAELRLLADGLTLSRIDSDEMHDIVKKLQLLAGDKNGRNVGYLKKLEFDKRVDASFLRNIDEMSRAIQKQHPIRCRYTHWNTHGKLVPNRRSDGKPAVHVLDPYQLVYKNGHYYLICRLHGADKEAPLSYWRADRISGVEVLEDSKVAPVSEALPGGAGFDVLMYMDGQPYPFSGETGLVKARTTSLEAIFDWFPRAHVTETGEQENGRPVYEAEFKTVLEPTEWWALQYASCVEVLEPKSLRDRITASAKDLVRKYR